MTDIYYAIRCGKKFVGYNRKAKCYMLTYNLGDACTWRDKSLADNCRLNKVRLANMSAKDKENELRTVEIEVRG